MELRISSGSAKNVKLNTPDFEAFRAVQEIAKQSLFSILADKIEDAVCLDLFAGSGNLGLEALSRGAAWCDFVDNNYDSRRVIEENIKKCKFGEQSEIAHGDAIKFVGNTSKKYDVIFLDPFYDDTSHKFLMKNIEEILKDDGVAIFLHGTNLLVETVIKDTKLKITTERKFGRSIVTFLSKQN